MKKQFLVLAVMVAIVFGFTAIVMAENNLQRHFVYFQVGKSDVDKQKVLDKLVNIKSDSIVEIYGYTDERGRADINIPLAQKRSETIAGVVKGVMPEVKIRVVKGMPYTDDKSVNATSGEIRIYTPVKVAPAVVVEQKDYLLNKYGFYFIVVGIIGLCSILGLLIWILRKFFIKAKLVWPRELSEIAEMFLEKLNGKDVKNCPFCGMEVGGKNYVGHLRRCVKSPLFEKDADETKTILMEARR
ncbi:MAG: hypothetical protein WCV70_00945 [Patescibacteria group bacterium]|jgi:hypothetical protein